MGRSTRSVQWTGRMEERDAAAVVGLHLASWGGLRAFGIVRHVLRLQGATMVGLQPQPRVAALQACALAVQPTSLLKECASFVARTLPPLPPGAACFCAWAKLTAL